MRIRLAFFLILALIGFSSTGYCESDHDHKGAHDHETEKHDDHEADDEHKGHDDHEEGHEESPSGASFRPGKGISITDETREIIGLETAIASEEKLPQEIRFNVQVYGDPHHFPGIDPEQTGCDVHGAGFVTEEKAALIQSGQKIVLKGLDGQMLEGFVVAVQKATAIGEAEVVVGVLNAESKLKDGQFVQTTLSIPREAAVVTIAATAVLKTLEGTFVYVSEGDYFHRTPVKTGSVIDGKIEIVEGVSAGDSVVVRPVETLWLIELRATKGGGHSH